MLSYEDCLGLSPLTEEEIALIAKHEHLPEIAALELGASLFETAQGRELIAGMILDDAKDACRHRDPAAVARLGLLLHRFMEAHIDRKRSPGARESCGPLSSYFSNMLGRFGVDAEEAQERFGSEMQVASMCCAICPQIGKVHPVPWG